MDADLNAVEGAWTLIPAESDWGCRNEDINLIKIDFMISGDHFALISSSEIGWYRNSGKLMMNSAMNPKTIDLIEQTMNVKTSLGETRLPDFFGIYELDGNRLKICMVVNNEDRPYDSRLRRYGSLLSC